MNAPARPVRVFQVATGNVGKEMIKRLQHQPDLELIGVHCYSPDKVGRDVGELAGIGPVGVKATGSIEEIIAARPDVLTLFYGTGMNPGLNQILGVVCSADVAEIENVTTIESVDVSCHHSKDTWIEVGYGLPVDDPEIPA
ncbi:dihydrodipicolinate reductase, partial [Mycobacterium sp. THU-M104]